jgi:hypothetical protein
MTPRTLAVLALVVAPALAQQPAAPPPATLPPPSASASPTPPSLAELASRLDEWLRRFRLSGFVAARAFDTERDGARPDGALGIQAATLFVDVAVQDVASAFLELRYDYFAEAGNNEAGIGEAYITLDDAFPIDPEHSVHVRVGRFDLPFGEYYKQEDPDQNRLVGFPAAIPYRWDEGVCAFGDFGSWGGIVALTDGTYSRNSQSGVAPAATLRLHARPAHGLYLSASGLYIHEADVSALCFGGSQIRPVSGSTLGSSASPEVQSSLGSLDVVVDASDAVRVQASVGGGKVNDGDDTFDRTLAWFMVEPSWSFAPRWTLTARYSGAGTFDDREGYRFEGRPYANGSASFGFDLASLERLQIGVGLTLATGLVAKAEVGFDRLRAVDASPLGDDTRWFTAAELVFAF